MCQKYESMRMQSVCVCVCVCVCLSVCVCESVQERSIFVVVVVFTPAVHVPEVREYAYVCESACVMTIVSKCE